MEITRRLFELVAGFVLGTSFFGRLGGDYSQMYMI